MSEHKANSPPVIASVVVLPRNPTGETELNLMVQAQDREADPISFHYQWMKNDAEIPGENQKTLKPNNFKKGDLIRVKVTPSDGKGDGKPFLSETVRILNSPPAVQEVWIEPKVAYASDDLKARVTSSDADGDSIHQLHQWEKNGVVMGDEKKEVLEKGRFKKGDSVTVSVTPDDGEAAGKQKKSEPVVILNGPPLIISSPATSVEGATYTYQVNANDPDGDPVIFSLRSGPKSMEVDKNTGLVRWEIHREDRGSHLVEIEASDDAGGKSFQRYTLSVEYNTRKSQNP